MTDRTIAESSSAVACDSSINCIAVSEDTIHVSDISVSFATFTSRKPASLIACKYSSFKDAPAMQLT